jgi:hypothetical protein
MNDEHAARSNTPDGPLEWMRERAIMLSDGSLAKATQQACGDLTPTLVGSRLQYLEKAAAAGVPHAVFGLMREGPWGDKSAMYTRWQDPAVQAWLARMLQWLELAARKGDLDALDTLVDQYRDGGGLVDKPDAAAALMYATAHSLACLQQRGQPVSRARQQDIMDLAAQLSSVEAASATQAGITLAGNIK